MKKNLPVTNREVTLEPGCQIISMTDLKGRITYVNQDFVDVSGFSRDELIGKSHNIVRHPDMPPAAFEDLWQTIQAGRPWSGIVKNRCKNGDHYWVEAFVTPVMRDGEVVGYQSVRSRPSEQQIEEAEALYAALNRKPDRPLPRRRRLSNLPIMLRLGVSLALIGALPFLGDSLWSLGLVGDTTMVALALAAPALLLALGIYIQRGMISPLMRLAEATDRIASGQLDNPLQYPYDDEIGRLFVGARIMQARLRTMVGQLAETATDLAVNSHQVSAGSTQSFELMLQQKQSTEQASQTMARLCQAAKAIAENTASAASSANEANQSAIEGKIKLSELQKTISALVGEVEDSASVITELDAKSQDISNILEVIRAIAEQTNLLALNAAIEAARAGEQGRGFAVVADEVRTLASRTADATNEINSVIEQLHQGIHSAVKVMHHGREVASNATGQSGEALESINGLTSAVVKMNTMNALIAQASQEQIGSVADAESEIGRIAEMAANTLALTQSNSEASNQLSSLSDNMLTLFRQMGMEADLKARAEQKIAERAATARAAPQAEDEIFF